MATDSQLADRVREFVARQTNYPLPKIAPETSLADDIGLAGDDADEFFVAFTEAFQVDPKSLDGRALVEEFGCEGWGCSWHGWLFFVAVLLPWVVLVVLGAMLGLPDWAVVVGLFLLPPSFGAVWGMVRGSRPTTRPDAIRVRDLVQAAAAGQWVKGAAARQPTSHGSS